MDMLTLLAVESANIMKALEIMWKGVVAIFIVIALIIVVTKVVNSVCVKADEKREAKQKADAEQKKQNQ